MFRDHTLLRVRQSMIAETVSAEKKTKTLFFSTLYPNSAQPSHGIFLEQRIKHIVQSGEIEAVVVAPMPWFPFRNSVFGSYRKYALAPKKDERNGVRVLYPRYLALPKIGMYISPFLIALSCLATVRNLILEGFDFDILDAYYFYPDGVAATILSKVFHKRLIITAFGTDINLIPRYRVPRIMIRWAGREARVMTSVCDALREHMIQLGLPGNLIHTILHGVDLRLFAPPTDRMALRRRLGLSGPTLLSVGHLIELKGHHLVIEALPQLPDARLLIVGEGEEKANLRELALRFGVSERVSFLGHVDQGDLPDVYGAADLLVLGSSREGIANVLLEAMACGTPVVATDVGGSREVITGPESGLLVQKRSSDALAEEIHRLLENYPDRAATRRSVERFSWDRTTTQHLALYEQVMADRRHATERTTG